MKKFYIFVAIASIAATASLSCTKEVQNESTSNEKETIPFTVFANSTQTKTTNDGLNTNWSDGDKINVFHAVAGSTTYINDGAFTLVNAATGEFSGSLASALSTGTNYDWYMIYPYNSNLTTPATTSTKGSGNYDYFTIGGKSQVQTGNNSTAHLCGSIIPFAGKRTDVADDVTPSLTLNPLTSVIAVNVTNNSGAELSVADISFKATESVVGTYFVNFAGASPVYTATQDYYVSTSAPLTVTSGTLANGSSAKYYIAIKPFTVSSGTLTLSVNGYERNKTISSETNFVAGHIKTLNFNYDEVIAAPISTESSDLTVNFEESDFTASTTYNNQTVEYNGPDGYQWGTLSGHVSTSGALAGTKSAQIRWYTSNAETISNTFTKYRMTSVGSVTFKAKNNTGASGVGLNVYYSLDNRSSWTLAGEYALTAETETYTLGLSEVKSNVAFKFEVKLPSPLPASSQTVYLDDIVFSKTVLNQTATSAPVAASDITATGATLNGSINLVNGAFLSSVTDAGFYYKAPSDGSYTKVSVSIPLTSSSISKTLTGLTTDVTYTYYTYVKYGTGAEVNSLPTTLTVTPSSTPSPKDYYKLVTSVSGITAGTYVVGALRSTSATDNFYFAKASCSSGDWVVSDGYVTVADADGVRRFETKDLPSGAVEFTLTGDNTNGFTITNGTKYLYYTSYASRKLGFATDKGTFKCKFEAKSSPLITGGVIIKMNNSGDDNGDYIITENSTGTGAIRGYPSTTGRGIYLFKKVNEI